MTKMTKKELVTQVSAATLRTKKEVKEVLEATLAAISNTLREGGSVSIADFGKLSTVTTKARKVRTPEGKEITVEPKQRIRFKAFEGITVYSQKN